jgi:ABC-type transporter Mla subunit MlaD
MSVGIDNGGPQRQGQQSSTQRAGSEGAPAPEWNAIKEDVTQIAGAAVEQGRQFLDSAKEQAAGYVDQRKDQAAESVQNIARSLRDACKQFDDRPNIRAFADSAAEGLEHFAETIRSRSFNELFEDVESVVRRRPGAVAAATMATGFLLARFIKSSAEGIREAEYERRRAQAGGNSGGRGQRARAQSSPGSSYAGSQT